MSSAPRALPTFRVGEEDGGRIEITRRRELIAGLAAVAVAAPKTAGARVGIGTGAELSQQLEVLQALVAVLAQEISEAKGLAAKETVLITGVKDALNKGLKPEEATAKAGKRKDSGPALIAKLTAAESVAQTAGEAASRLEFSAAADAAGFQASSFGVPDAAQLKNAATKTASVQAGAAKAREQLIAAAATTEIANAYAVASAKAIAKLPEELTGVTKIKNVDDFIADVQDGASQKRLKGAAITVALIAAGKAEGKLAEVEEQVQAAAAAIKASSAELVEPPEIRFPCSILGLFAMASLILGVAGSRELRKTLRASTSVHDSLLPA
jgi:hypothetical protein